eukprot:7433032-Lingulodinium_polyedra.AAC.1
MSLVGVDVGSQVGRQWATECVNGGSYQGQATALRWVARSVGGIMSRVRWPRQGQFALVRAQLGPTVGEQWCKPRIERGSTVAKRCSDLGYGGFCAIAKQWPHCLS